MLKATYVDVCVLTRMLSHSVDFCPTLYNLIVCSPPGSSIRGIFQARILEWVAVSFSRGYSQPSN